MFRRKIVFILLFLTYSRMVFENWQYSIWICCWNVLSKLISEASDLVGHENVTFWSIFLRYSRKHFEIYELLNLLIPKKKFKNYCCGFYFMYEKNKSFHFVGYEKLCAYWFINNLHGRPVLLFLRYSIKLWEI